MAPDASAALASLLRASTIDDHEEALRLADLALKPGGRDFRTQKTKLVALLKLDRFEDALRVSTAGGDELGQACNFETAYALYKTGRLDEAATFLGKVNLPETRHVRHLAAQIAYRGERFQDAVKMYRQLASNAQARGGEDNDLAINILATAAQLGWQGTINQHGSDRGHAGPDSFELAYNSACGCIARGDFAGASKLLHQALRLCDRSGDLTETEKKLEMLPMMMQRAYVCATLGQVKEALSIYESLPLTR
jgi:signal recognition particle subunit SRP72